MSKKPEDKAEKSKFTNIVSCLINRIQNLKLGKNKTKNFNPETGIVQERSKSIHSKKNASVCDSVTKTNYSSLNDTKSFQLYEDPIVQNFEEVKGKSLKKHVKSQNASCLHKNNEAEAIVSVQLATTPIAPENEVKLNNIDSDKSIKSEPIDEYDGESEITCASWKNKFKDSDRLLNEHSNYQHITCLNRNIKDEEIDKIDYKLEYESEDEDIIERGPDKTPKNKERHSEYSLKKDQEATGKAILQNVTFPADIETLNLHHINERIIADIEIEKRIADIKNKERIAIEIEKRIAKINVDKEITNSFIKLLRVCNNFVRNTDSISNPAINSQELKTEARFKLFTSENFSKDIYSEECLQMISWIQGLEFISNGRKVIHYLKLFGRKKYRRTNLHDAVMNGNLEKTLCIVEIHKWYHNDLFDINAKDSSNPKKTALDWAYEAKNSLLIDYLKENLATRAVHIKPINTPGA